MPANKPADCMQPVLHTEKNMPCMIVHSVGLLMVWGPIEGSEIALAACS